MSHNQLSMFNSDTKTNTISSLELLKQINLFRSEIDGKSELAHSDLLKVIRDEFEDELGEGKISLSSYFNSQNKSQPMYILTISQAKQVLVRESKAVRKAVIKKLEELENVNRTPTTYLEALKALVQKEEEKELLKNEVQKLNTDLDNLLDYASIIKVANHNKVSELCFNWRLLKAKSIELDLDVKRVPSPRYGYQNLYSIQAFKVVYPEFNYNF